MGLPEKLLDKSVEDVQAVFDRHKGNLNKTAKELSISVPRLRFWFLKHDLEIKRVLVKRDR